jgi:VIT1/CCC1 family predicted Fe2+/Mn2+ transporter
MDSNSTLLEESLKKEIQTALVTNILNALEANKITVVEMKEISNYLLDNMVQVKYNSQLLELLESLKGKWPVLEDTYKIYKNKLLVEKEKLVMQRLANLVRKGKIN